VGFGIGLEFRESSHVLRAKNTTLVQAGMAFNVVVGAPTAAPVVNWFSAACICLVPAGSYHSREMVARRL
jgi:hypothetical protein